MATLKGVAQLLYGDSEAITGWEGSQEDLIALAARSFPGKAFCA